MEELKYFDMIYSTNRCFVQPAARYYPLWGAGHHPSDFSGDKSQFDDDTVAVSHDSGNVIINPDGFNLYATGFFMNMFNFISEGEIIDNCCLR